MKKTITIKLTDARPMRVSEANWPIGAEATKERDHNQQQLFRRYYLRVRAHAVEGGAGGLEYYGNTEATAPALDFHPDGAVLVYGWRDTSWQGESNTHAGHLCTLAEAAATIRQVGGEIGASEQLVLECIGDLPPVENKEPGSLLAAYSTEQLATELEQRKTVAAA